MSLILIIMYVIATASGLILIKMGSSSGAPISIIEHSLKLNLNLQIILGLCLYAFSFLLYTYLISKFNLGFIIPITTALVYILIFIASFLIFKESFTAIKVVAICLIVIGVIILNLNK